MSESEAIDILREFVRRAQVAQEAVQAVIDAENQAEFDEQPEQEQ